MIQASPSEQRDLLTLQEIDTAIRLLEHRRANLPEQQALDAEVDLADRVKRELAEARLRADRLRADAKRHEDQIATLDVRRKADENRMYSGAIQSERELDALRHELEGMRNRKGDLEDSLLEIMEQQEEVGSLLDTLDERAAEIGTRVQELALVRDTAAGDIDAELAQQRERRVAAVASVPERLHRPYDELRTRKGGTAVAALAGRRCTGCQLVLTATELEELEELQNRGLSACAQCGRWLVRG